MTDEAKEAWGSGGPYDRYVGRWSRMVAREFLAWLEAPAGSSWGDVGCGTGALAESILSMNQPDSVLAVDRSKGFVMEARPRLNDPRVQFEVGDAIALPWKNDLCDFTVSGLVLNFMPNPAAMAAEMARVTRAGGRVAAYVWDYSGGMEMMRRFWDVALEVSPEDRALDQAERFPICQPEPLQQLFRNAGLTHLAVRAIDIPTIFRSFEDYWLPFLGKQGAAPTYLASVGSQKREQIRATLRSRLIASPDGSIHLMARAWAVQGTV